MHTEGEIRGAVRLLLERYGRLTTTEVKEKLEEVLAFDDEDRIVSTVRNEYMILQRIGNIVSHQVEDIKTYDEGFTVDKRGEIAIFYLSN